jgi:hypothetical protein
MTEVIKVAPCPTCGRELNYVEQYGQYYCYTCQQYHQPGAQAAPPPPPPPPPPVHGPPPGAPRSKTPLLIAGVVIIVIIIILAAVFLLITPEEEGDTVTMDMNDLRKNFTADGLKNLTAGDTIYVEDEIIYMADKYDEDYETTVTYIWLESAHGGESLSNWRVYDYSDDEYDYINMDFTIEGDITDEYDTGDKIRITLNVIIIDDNGETREFFDEMWDGKKIVPLLESVIKLLLEEEGDTVNMDMVDLRNNFTSDGIKNLEPGDTLIIEDEIIYIASDYDDEYDKTVTYIWLESAHADESLSDWREYDYDNDEYDYFDIDFKIDGDITDEYDIGDKIRITLHVIKIDDNGVTREFFEEMWDGNSVVPLTESAIKLISEKNGEDVARFPTIEVNLRDNGPAESDTITIKHVQGDPLDWSDYKLIITNNTTDFSTTMTNLNSLGQITAGEQSKINVTIAGFTGLNYLKAYSYTIEIYDLKENKRVYVNDNRICE